MEEPKFGTTSLQILF